MSYIRYHNWDSSKYPANMGKSWKQEEIVKLMLSIQKKRSIEDIAKDHQRTVGGINAYIRKIAADYWFHGDKTMDDIKKYTGLSHAEIQEAINKRKQTEEPETVKEDDDPQDTVDVETLKDNVLELKKDIIEMKQDMKTILSFIHSLNCKKKYD
jgi:hypothetical protein